MTILGLPQLGRRWLCGVMAFIFAVTSAGTSYAQTVLNLPAVGTAVHLSPAFSPLLIKGVSVHPENAMMLDFIVDPGQSGLSGDAVGEQTRKLIKYFMAALAVPEDDLWVNLSPYENDRIIPDALGMTEMGRDMLAQDYLLKQITSSLIDPETALGRKFWDRIYQEAFEQYGTTDIPVDTFNKVWIMPAKAVVYENNGKAVVVDSRLKVMLDSDYLAQEKAGDPTGRPYGTDLLQGERRGEAVPRPMMPGDSGVIPGATEGTAPVLSGLTKNIMRSVILPALEEEVNAGSHFAQIRQIYNALILAHWFRMNFKKSILHQIYADRAKIQGVDVNDKEISKKIYAQYVASFKKGVYNYIKEEYDPATQDMIPRKYFSGGERFDAAALNEVTTVTQDEKQAEKFSSDTTKAFIVQASLMPQTDKPSRGDKIRDAVGITLIAGMGVTRLWEDLILPATDNMSVGRVLFIGGAVLTAAGLAWFWNNRKKDPARVIQAEFKALHEMLLDRGKNVSNYSEYASLVNQSLSVQENLAKGLPVGDLIVSMTDTMANSAADHIAYAPLSEALVRLNLDDARFGELPVREQKNIEEVLAEPLIFKEDDLLAERQQAGEAVSDEEWDARMFSAKMKALRAQHIDQKLNNIMTGDKAQRTGFNRLRQNTFLDAMDKLRAAKRVGNKVFYLRIMLKQARVMGLTARQIARVFWILNSKTRDEMSEILDGYRLQGVSEGRGDAVKRELDAGTEFEDMRSMLEASPEHEKYAALIKTIQVVEKNLSDGTAVGSSIVMVSDEVERLKGDQLYNPLREALDVLDNVRLKDLSSSDQYKLETSADFLGFLPEERLAEKQWLIDGINPDNIANMFGDPVEFSATMRRLRAEYIDRKLGKVVPSAKYSYEQMGAKNATSAENAIVKQWDLGKADFVTYDTAGEPVVSSDDFKPWQEGNARAMQGNLLISRDGKYVLKKFDAMGENDYRRFIATIQLLADRMQEDGYLERVGKPVKVLVPRLVRTEDGWAFLTPLIDGNILVQSRATKEFEDEAIKVAGSVFDNIGYANYILEDSTGDIINIDPIHTGYFFGKIALLSVLKILDELGYPGDGDEGQPRDIFYKGKFLESHVKYLAEQLKSSDEARRSKARLALKEIEETSLSLNDMARKALRSEGFSSSDKAANTGGIDFKAKNMKVDVRGEGVDFQLPESLRNMNLNNIQGLTPVIINVTPVTNMPAYLGLSEIPAGAGAA